MAKTIVTTAKGVAFYPRLDRPDTKFDENGKFNTGLILDAKGFAAFKKELDAFVKDNKFKTKKPKLPYEKHEDGDGYIIKAASKYRPVIFDGKNRKLFDPENEAHEGKDLRIAGGSLMRLKVELHAYDNGVNLYLKAVQITKLVQWEGNSFEEDTSDDEEEDTSDDEEDFTEDNEDDDSSSDNDEALDI